MNKTSKIFIWRALSQNIKHVLPWGENKVIQEWIHFQTKILKIVILSEVSLTEKDKYHTKSLICVN